MRSKQVSVKREIRPLRSTWRGLETWHGRDAVTPRNRKGEEKGDTNCDPNPRARLPPHPPRVRGATSPPSAPRVHLLRKLPPGPPPRSRSRSTRKSRPRQ